MDPALAREVRAAARAFFALPTEVKARYAVRIGGRGWLPPGVEANAYAEGTETPPDLKESYAVGADTPVGDPEIDRVWFPPNVWPAKVPTLRPAVQRYLAEVRELADRLLRLCARALGLPADTLTSLAGNPTWTFNINRYPPLTEVGPPAPNQYRIGPHTDFGTVTVLDREPGAGGLQIHTEADGWVDAPYNPATLTVNAGDLLAHWTGSRWRSGRHRVLAPQSDHPHEELISLVFFYELDHNAVVIPLSPPLGRRADLPPVVSAPLHPSAAGCDLGVGAVGVRSQCSRGGSVSAGASAGRSSMLTRCAAARAARLVRTSGRCAQRSSRSRSAASVISGTAYPQESAIRSSSTTMMVRTPECGPKWASSVEKSGSAGVTTLPRPNSRRIFAFRVNEQNMIVIRPFWRRWAIVSTPLPSRSR